MDLGIAGRKALVCASSQGLGWACAQALAREGVHVTINGRNSERLQNARKELQKNVPEVQVSAVVADITSDSGRAALLEKCRDIDILVNNNAGPPPGGLEEWSHDAWIGAFEANMIAPMLLIRALVPGMRQRRFGRVVNITSAMVKTPRYVMGLSTAARTALTAACKALSQEAAPDNVTINNLLPERIDTPRQEFMAQRMMREQQITRAEARRRIELSVAARRFGTPEEFGSICAYLCGQQAGFISGQNIQVDGGSYSALI